MAFDGHTLLSCRRRTPGVDGRAACWLIVSRYFDDRSVFVELGNVDRERLHLPIPEAAPQPRKAYHGGPAHDLRAVRFLFLVGMVYEPTLPIWEYMWLLANIIGGTGIAVLFGMYWRRASTAGAYAAVLVSLALPLTDLAARSIDKTRRWSRSAVSAYATDDWLLDLSDRGGAFNRRVGFEPR